MKANVKATVFYANEVPHGIDAEIGVAHAKSGFPVEVRIERNNTTQVLHLSNDEANEMVRELSCFGPVESSKAKRIEELEDALRLIERQTRKSPKSGARDGFINDTARKVLGMPLAE